MASIKYLLKIIFTVLLLAFVAWIGLRGWGMSRPVAELHHPLFEKPGPWLVFQAEKDTPPARLMSLYWEASRISPEVLLQFQIQFDPSSDSFYLSGTAQLEALEKILIRFPDRFLVLDIQNNLPGAADNLVKILSDHGARERVLIASRQDGFLRDVRRAAPEMAFGTGQGSLTQFLLLRSFLLEPLQRISGDVVVFPSDLVKERGLFAGHVREIHRQKKRVIVNYVSDIETAESLLDQGADGFVFTSLATLNIAHTRFLKKGQK